MRRPDQAMRVYSGGWFWPLAPRASEVRLVDIAHALSLLNRYAGHTTRPYSVAEHCCRMAAWFAGMHPTRPSMARWALLHDAAEAYLVDVPRPIKAALGRRYQKAEARCMEAICARFAFWPNARDEREVKLADTRIIRDEMVALFADHWDPVELLGVETLGVEIPGGDAWRSPEFSERWWLDLAASLGLM